MTLSSARASTFVSGVHRRTNEAAPQTDEYKRDVREGASSLGHVVQCRFAALRYAAKEKRNVRIPWIEFRKGERKDTVVQRYRFGGASGVVLIKARAAT